jgi:hypothetical protein
MRATIYLSGDSEIEEELEAIKERLKVVSRRAERAALREETRDTPSTRADLELMEHLEEQISDLKEVSKANAIEIVFQSMGRKEYSALVDQHPPTEAQLVDGKKVDLEIAFNPDTFPVDLIAHCIINVEATPEELVEYLNSDQWNSGEIAHMFNTCVNLNMTRRLADMGKD